MRHPKKTRLSRVLFVAGLAMLVYPLVGALGAQQPPPQGGGAPGMINMPTEPALRGFRWRSIGPVSQGGRIDDIAVVETNIGSTATYYLGFATGGLWKTTNNGTTFDPIFDTYSTHSIGDIAIAPSNPDILYIGTGEPNNRQSSSFGDGMFKSTNAGQTFSQIGLRETQSIARVVVHPRNPDIVWVAAVGHLFGPNPERGVFMTTDGGQNWTKTLFVNANTGATDLVVDPSNPNVLFAATYQRERKAFGFVGSGPGSGIHQSSDGGKTWRKLTGSGLPTGVIGRIGLDISRSNPNVIYAQIETALTPSQLPPAPAAAADPGAAGRAGAGQRGGAAGAAGAGAAGGGQRGGGGGRGGAPQPPNPNASGVWKSTDKGRTWTFLTNENNRPMYYSQIRVDPTDENIVYVGGQNAAKSTDGGKNFSSIQGNGMGHVDNHAIWINPFNNKHVMYGNDGSLDVSYDGAQNFEAVRLWAVGQPYHVSVDMGRPYYVCTGLQDNGSWCGPSSVRGSAIRAWHWYGMGGGDGFQTQIDPTDFNIVYSESQNAGNVGYYDLRAGTRRGIQPNPGRAGGGGGAAGGGGGGGRGGGGGAGNVVPQPPQDTSFNFPWNTPIVLSPHNPRKVLLGGNRVFISLDRGDTWQMSEPLGKNLNYVDRQVMGMAYGLPGCGRGGGGGGRAGGGGAPSTPAPTCILSKGDGVGATEAATVIEISESSVVPGIIWAGTGDGNVQVSKDDGRTWTEVGKNVPGGTREYWVSGLEASHFDAATAYLALDGHHQDDLKPYVFKTTDYGATWTNIAGNLPLGQVNSIRQDPVNRSLLYAPVEFGFYISLNEGQSWHRFMPNLPMVRTDEVVVHPRENDLVLATHGRSIWILDDVSALQQMTPQMLQAQGDATLFTPRDAVSWRGNQRNGGVAAPGRRSWAGQSAPAGTAIAYYLKSAPAGDVRITITNTATGQAIRTCAGTKDVGMNRFQWTFATDGGGGGGGGGRGGGGRGGGGGAGAGDPAQPPPAPGSQPCSGGDGGGGGRGGRGGGGLAGGMAPGVYRVTLAIGGRDVDSKTFRVLEDVWVNER